MAQKGEEKDDGKKKSRGSSGASGLAQGLEDVKKQLARGVNREDILVQIKDLEKEQLKERIVELELANQQLLRRNALMQQNFEQLRMNVAVLKAKLELAFEEETTGPPASLMGKQLTKSQSSPKGRGLTISQFRDDWKRGVSNADLRNTNDEDGAVEIGSPSVHRVDSGGKSFRGRLMPRSEVKKKGVNTDEKGGSATNSPVKEKDNDKGKEKTLRTVQKKREQAMAAAEEKDKEVEVRERTLKNEVLGEFEEREGDEHSEGIVLSIKESATAKKIIKVRAGTPIKLLERLAYAEAPDPDYATDFVVTFTRFMKPADLLDFLCIRFLHAKGQDNETVVRLRVVNVIKLWIERSNQLLLRKTKMKQRIAEFVNVLMGTSGMNSAATSVKNLIERILKENEGLVEYEVQVLTQKHFSIIRKGDFTKLKEEEVGSQLTLIQHQLWTAITPSDFFKFAQEDYGQSLETMSFRTATAKMLYLTSAIQRWIELEFSCKDIDEGTVLTKLVNIAEHCLQFKNFNGVFDIMSGIRNALKEREDEVLRMSAAADTKKKGLDVSTVFNRLKQFTAEKNDYENYRMVLLQQSLPSVPCFAPFWKRWQDAKDIPDRFSSGYVNFEKLAIVANIVKDIQTYQKVHYAIQPLKSASDYLLEVLQLKAKSGA